MFSDTDPVPDYVPVQGQPLWRDAWNATYQAAIEEGFDEMEAEVRAYLAALAAATPATAAEEATVGDKFKHVYAFKVIDKADDSGKIVHTVVGIATSEAEDHDGEKAQYEGTVNAFKVWSDAFLKSTSASGQQLSLGNIRVQHDSKQIGGKVTAINPKDAEKAIEIHTQPLDEVYETLIEPGMVTGFSIAGRYAKQWTDSEGKWYIPEISEISYVDNPCNPDAGFTHVKANGQIEFRKFSDLRAAAAAKSTAGHVDVKQIEDAVDRGVSKYRQELIDAGIIIVKEKKAKKVDGVNLPSSCFAYVGNEDDPTTWLLAYKGFPTEAKNKAVVRQQLSRFSRTQGIPAGEREKVKGKLVGAAKKHGLEVTEHSAKAVRSALVRILTEQTDEAGKARYDRKTADAMAATVDEVFKLAGTTPLAKGMYTVESLAGILESLSWLVVNTEYEREYEDDDSSVPEDLRGCLEDLIPVFVALATEEANELLHNKTANGGNGGKSMSEQTADLLKAAKAAFAELWKKAKSAFHKMAKSHEAVGKCFGKAAEHHTDLAEHHADAAEACAGKAVEAELLKLADTADFKKQSKLDQLMAKADLIVEKAVSVHAKAFGKMAKCHAGIAKCMDKANTHCDELGKAAVDVGSAEDAPDGKVETTEAHPGGSSDKAAADKAAADKAAADALAKGANPELVAMLKDGFAGITSRMDGFEAKMGAIEKDVKAQGDKMEAGPAGNASRLANPTGNGRDAGNGNGSGEGSKSRLSSASVNKATNSQTAGIFGNK
jgi:hypothetical protein